MVIVQWPNGYRTECVLVRRDTEGSEQVDMNDIPDTFTRRTHYVRISYYGKRIEVPIKGLKVYAAETSKPRSKKSR